MPVASVFDLILIGRGAAGVAVAHALARRGWRGRLGWFGDPTTLAFHRARPEHLLNTRAGTMGIDPNALHGFVDWARAAGLPYPAADFPHRRAFGAYLDACAADACRRFQSGVVVHDAPSLPLQADDHGLFLRDGEKVWRAPTVIAATGYGGGREALHTDALDPWTAPYEALAKAKASVAIVGSGLSALDAVHSLRSVGHRGAITLIARRAHAPFAHASEPGAQARAPLAEGSLSQSLFALRDEAKRHDWRDVLHAARPFTPAWWANLPVAQRHAALRPARLDLWSLLRHRAPPQTRAHFDDAVAEGMLTLHAGMIHTVQRAVQGFVLFGDAITVHADAVIDARGPSLDFTRSPLFASLLATGVLAASPTGLGLKSDADGLLGSYGDTRLYGIGAVHFGERLETTGFAELRTQADALAARLAEAHSHG